VEGSIEMFFWRLVGSGRCRVCFMGNDIEEGGRLWRSEGGRLWRSPRLT
jgi:hypothetical protein